MLLAAGLFSGVGCDTIRDYSISSYQGPLPANDMRIGSGGGSVAPKPDADAVVAAQSSAVPLNAKPTPSEVPAGSAPVLNNQAPDANTQRPPQ